jgi:WD40 repeat protein/predicted nucleic acid-binding Zn ribbon protein
MAKQNQIAAFPIDPHSINTGNPYPGLRAFRPEEAELFRGRDEEVLDALRILKRTHLLAVLGPSGIGKTSLVQAGIRGELATAKVEGRGGRNWEAMRFIPGKEPIKDLASALEGLRIILPPNDNKPESNTQLFIEEKLRRNSQGLVELFKDSRLCIRNTQRGKEIFSFEGNLFLFIDQFENLFTEGVRNVSHFLNLLVNASQARDFPIYIVLGLHSDYIGGITEYSTFTEAVMEGRFVVPAINRSQLEAALTEPADLHGVGCSPRLVDAVLSEIHVSQEEEAGGESPSHAFSQTLPAFQYLMWKVWDNWRGGFNDHGRRQLDLIDLDPEQVTGGVGLEEVLNHELDEIYEELDDEFVNSEFPEKRKWICEVLFKAITEKRGATTYAPRKEPVTVNDIALSAGVELYGEPRDVTDPGHAEDLIEVIKAFGSPGRSFLSLSTAPYIYPDTQVAISHQFIIDNWPRLQKWIDKESEAGLVYRSLVEKRSIWNATVTNKDQALLQNPNLDIAWAIFFPDKPKEYVSNCAFDEIANEGVKRPNKWWAVRYSSSEELKQESLISFTQMSAFETHERVFEESLNYLKLSQKRACEEDKKKILAALNRKRRDRFLAIFFGILMLVALVFFGMAAILGRSAWKSSNAAMEQAILAAQASFEAEKNLKDALEARLEAETAQKNLAISNTKLNKTVRELDIKSREADSARRVAVENERIALENMYRAAKSAEEAQENARVAREESERAEENQRYATSLSKRAQAQAMAANSQRQTEDPALQALLAREAFFLNQREACDDPEVVFNPYDPNIYLGLNNALETLEGEDYNTILVQRPLQNPLDTRNEYPHQGVVRGMVFLPPGEDTTREQVPRVYSSSADGKIYKLDPEEVRYFDSNFNKHSLLSIRKQNTDKLPLLSSYLLPPKLFRVMAVSANQRWLALAGDMPSIYLVSVLNKLAPPLKIVAHQEQGVYDMVTTHFQNHMGFLSAGADGRIAWIPFQNWDSVQPRSRPLFQPEDTVVSLAVSRDNRFVAGGSRSGLIFLWEWVADPDGLPVLRLKKRLNQTQGKTITTLTFGPDPFLIATGHADGTVQLWDLRTETFVARNEHKAGIVDLSFSPGYTFLASASYDRSVLVFPLEERKFQPSRVGSQFDFLPPVRLVGQSMGEQLPWATSLAFDEQGEVLFVGYRNGIVKQWHMRPDWLATRICEQLSSQRMSTSLTPRQWVRYMGNSPFYCGTSGPQKKSTCE